MSGRGMKKWAPYSSLIEQSTCLEKMRYEKNKIEKPKISSEEAETINSILISYNKEEVIITYFYDGYIYKLSTFIKRIDVLNKMIILETGKIPFSALIKIEYKNSNKFDF
ncbi:MAG TPA: YolD-like family protein [Firmicutes bacterium]|nr:YolD-like family protein [Bacillota bacterium]